MEITRHDMECAIDALKGKHAKLQSLFPDTNLEGLILVFDGYAISRQIHADVVRYAMYKPDSFKKFVNYHESKGMKLPKIIDLEYRADEFKEAFVKLSGIETEAEIAKLFTD